MGPTFIVDEIRSVRDSWQNCFYLICPSCKKIGEELHWKALLAISGNRDQKKPRLLSLRCQRIFQSARCDFNLGFFARLLKILQRVSKRYVLSKMRCKI